MTCRVKLILYYDVVQKHVEQRLAQMVAGPLLAQAAGQAHASEYQRCPSSNRQQLGKFQWCQLIWVDWLYAFI